MKPDYAAEHEKRNPGSGAVRARKSKYKHCNNFDTIINAYDDIDCCMLCGKKFKPKNDKCIDHYGSVIRGIICKKCNTALGSLGDTPMGLMNALHYLKESGAHEISD